MAATTCDVAGTMESQMAASLGFELPHVQLLVLTNPTCTSLPFPTTQGAPRILDGCLSETAQGLEPFQSTLSRGAECNDHLRPAARFCVKLMEDFMTGSWRPPGAHCGGNTKGSSHGDGEQPCAAAQGCWGAGQWGAIVSGARTTLEHIKWLESLLNPTPASGRSSPRP